MLSKCFPAIVGAAFLLVFVPSGKSHAAGPVPPKAGSQGVASIAGRIRFEGSVPKPLAINMAADPGCLKVSPGAHSQTLVAGTDGGLENVVVFIQRGLGEQSFDVAPEPVVIEQKGCMYQPHVVALRTNQKLRVTNSDAVSHNIHPTPANNREWNKAQPPGTTIEESFAREEIAIPIKCNVHPWMRGYIAVFRHPFFAITGADGTFTLHDVPPGEYVIAAWHEKLGMQTQKVTIGTGESKTVDFAFKGGR